MKKKNFWWKIKKKFDDKKMLGRKQSLKGELILADYGPEESLNENADIEWVNKVSVCVCARDLIITIVRNDVQKYQPKNIIYDND